MSADMPVHVLSHLDPDRGAARVDPPVSELNFSSPGCWQVSGTVGGKALTFVVNVAAY